VASELERRWNEALEKVQQLETGMERSMRGREVAPATREEFEALAGDLEAVWNHPESDARLKKRILRTLIEEVVVDVDSQGGRSLRWFTGRAAYTRSFAFLANDVATAELTRPKR
jgi:predicted NAD-dependent protein-ADP-ribosyltransferase YbiA (DUF1768 family)